MAITCLRHSRMRLSFVAISTVAFTLSTLLLAPLANAGRCSGKLWPVRTVDLRHHPKPFLVFGLSHRSPMFTQLTADGYSELKICIRDGYTALAFEIDEDAHSLEAGRRIRQAVQDDLIHLHVSKDGTEFLIRGDELLNLWTLAQAGGNAVTRKT